MLGFGQREWGKAVLQILQIARHGYADDVGARGEKLAELQIGRSQACQRA